MDKVEKEKLQSTPVVQGTLREIKHLSKLAKHNSIRRALKIMYLTSNSLLSQVANNQTANRPFKKLVGKHTIYICQYLPNVIHRLKIHRKSIKNNKLENEILKQAEEMYPNLLFAIYKINYKSKEITCHRVSTKDFLTIISVIQEFLFNYGKPITVSSSLSNSRIIELFNNIKGVTIQYILKALKYNQICMGDSGFNLENVSLNTVVNMAHVRANIYQANIMSKFICGEINVKGVKEKINVDIVADTSVGSVREKGNLKLPNDLINKKDKNKLNQLLTNANQMVVSCDFKTVFKDLMTVKRILYHYHVA